ncbi:MAG: hypothetical protein Q9171_000167 [Xanthocarpia ochracea]
MTISPKPIVLLLGEVLHAKNEWHDLAEIAELRQLKDGNREQFLEDCRSGVHYGILAISRTYDSVELTGRFDQELIDNLPQTLKFISHNGAGYDQIDAEACANRGISVSNTPGAVDASTANTAIYLLLGALRRAHVPATALREGRWRGSMGLGHDPDGKSLGILGMGGIGSAFSLRAATFGFKLQYHNRNPVVDPSRNPTNAKYVDFEELLRTSDVISIHLPLNDATRGLIGRKEFEMMKDGVVIVNTARGQIMNEEALIEALERDKVFAAGLDVYEKEPEVHPGLIKSDKVVLMPHVGTATVETQRKMEVLIHYITTVDYSVDLLFIAHPGTEEGFNHLPLVHIQSSTMLNILVTGATLVVLSILSFFNPGNVLQTIAAGVENTFSGSVAWENPFPKTSFIELADASIALFADHVWPAIIPGSTGTGRPYVVSLSDLENLSESRNLAYLNGTLADMSDPLVYIHILRESMTWVDREPFTEAQVIRGVLLTLLALFTILITGTFLIRHNIRYKFSALDGTVSKLEATISGLHTAMSQNASVLGFIERLCHITRSDDSETVGEPLRQLNTEMRATGQIPYLPSLTSHIDFVLYTIDSASDRYNESVTVAAERDRALLILEKVEKRIEELEHVDGKLKEANISRGKLQTALDAKTVDLDRILGQLTTVQGELQKVNVQNGQLRTSLEKKTEGHENVLGELRQANTKCDGLENELRAVKGDLRGANVALKTADGALQVAKYRWDAFCHGPGDMKVASATPLPGFADGESEGLTNDPKLEPASAPKGTDTSPPNPAQGRGRSETRSNPPTSKGRSSTPSNVSRLGDASPVKASSPPHDRSGGSPIRSTTSCLFEGLKKRTADEEAARKVAPSNGPGDAAAAQYGGFSQSGSSPGPSSSFRGQGFNHRGQSSNPRGRGSSHRGQDFNRPGHGSNGNRGGRGEGAKLAPWLEKLLQENGGKLP